MKDWDREADQIIAALTALGAREIVVTDDAHRIEVTWTITFQNGAIATMGYEIAMTNHDLPNWEHAVRTVRDELAPIIARVATPND